MRGPKIGNRVQVKTTVMNHLDQFKAELRQPIARCC